MRSYGIQGHILWSQCPIGCVHTNLPVYQHTLQICICPAWKKVMSVSGLVEINMMPKYRDITHVIDIGLQTFQQLHMKIQ